MTHKYSEEIAEKVKDLASYGMDHKRIAKHVGIGSDNTLRKYYGDILNSAMTENLHKVAKQAWALALEGDKTMICFILKTQGGWRETDRDDEQSTGTEPINRIQIEVIQPDDKKDTE